MATKKAASKKPAKKVATKKTAAKKKPAAKKSAAAKKPAAKKPAAKKPAAKKPAAKKPAAKKKTAAKKPARSPAAVAYGNAVGEIIDHQSRASSYRPTVELDLRIVNRRAPSTGAELHPEERVQVAAFFHPEPLDVALGNPEYELEAAEVVDADGALRYRLYGWNYGVGYLMAPSGLDIVGFGAQHDIEHWNRAQRDVFVAMDRALAKKDHGFRQPLSFCWWREECWDELDGQEPGKAGSEPYLRKVMAKVAEQT
jgi:hypothetical protein